MALKSGGTIPPFRGVVDANQAHAILDTIHHWRLTRINRADGCPGYDLKITHAGKRVSAVRRTFVECVNVAMGKLRDGDAPKLKLAKY